MEAAGRADRKRRGLRCDQTICLQSFYPAKFNSQPLRRIPYRDAETEKNLIFLTNNFLLPTLTIAQLYKGRWQVESFFKWVKQHLRIKKFYGLSPNAVKSEVWISISVFVLLAILRKRLDLGLSLESMSQILNPALFEKMPLLRAFSQINGSTELAQSATNSIWSTYDRTVAPTHNSPNFKSQDRGEKGSVPEPG